MTFRAAALAFAFAVMTPARPALAQFTGMADREHIAIHIAHLWDRENFSELEKLAYSYRTSATKSASGRWMISVFYDVLSKLMGPNIAAAEGPGSAKIKLARWTAFAPSSPTPYIVKVIELRNAARAFDIDTALATSAPQNYAPVIYRSRTAYDMSASIRQIADSDPYWHSQNLELMSESGANSETFFKALSEAIARFPMYEGLYWAAGQHLLSSHPKDLQQFEDFATWAYEKTREVAGAEAYAMAYHYALAGQMTVEDVQRGPIKWDRFFQGWDAHIARHPDQLNRNFAARYACISAHTKRTREAFMRMSGGPVRSVWSSEKFFEACRRSTLD